MAIFAAPLAVPPPAVEAPAAPSATPFKFLGSKLGTPLPEWRAKAPPQPVSTCGPAAKTAPIYRCRMPDVKIGGYRTRNLTYTFKDGRLAAISFATSIDAFDDVVAALKTANGAPSATRSDHVKLSDGLVFPHVAMVWRRSGSQILLSDPGPRGVQLFVTIAADAAPLLSVNKAG